MKTISKYTLQILLFVILLSCSKDSVSPKPSGKIQFVNSFHLNVPEPSGLTFSTDSLLWTVSDKNSRVYLLNQSGKMQREFIIAANDLEGVTIVGHSLLAVVLEGAREIVIVSFDGFIHKRIKTDLQGKKNKGLEGITYIPSDSTFIIANEKDPTLLIRISISGNIISKDTINFADDLSGLFYDEIRNQLWILSEQSNLIFRCDLSYSVLETYGIPDEKIEGIAVSGNVLFLVSDKTEKLYKYNILEK